MNMKPSIYFQLNYYACEVYECKYTQGECECVCIYLLVIVGACNIEKLVIGRGSGNEAREVPASAQYLKRTSGV